MMISAIAQLYKPYEPPVADDSPAAMSQSQPERHVDHLKAQYIEQSRLLVLQEALFANAGAGMTSPISFYERETRL